MNCLFIRDHLFELYNAVDAVHIAWETEFFAFESSVTATWEFALMVGGVIARNQNLEVSAILTAGRDSHSAVGDFMRFECLPLDVVARAS